MKTMNKKNSILLFFIGVICILFFLKIDYRYKADWPCCSDEFDYFSHIKTIVEDKDFDYSNQFGDFKDARNIINGKPTPIGFIGSSIFSLPFYIVGKFLSNFESVNNSNFNNFELIMTSLSSTFYLFLTYILFIKISILLNKTISHLEILFLILGSGLSYFAFERYLMPHVFEVFSITLVFYFSIRFFKTGNKLFVIVLPYIILLALLVKWTNYHVLFVPIIIKYLFFENKTIDNHKISILVNSIIAFLLFLQINKLIYGIYTLNPLKIYSSDSSRVDVFLTKLLSDPAIVVIESIKSTLLILFGPEFGLFWFSPIIFLGFIKIFFHINKTSTFFIIISFGYQLLIVIMWGTTASSYGYRYLFNLIPLSYILILYSRKLIFEKYYIYAFSLFAFISTLLFETTKLTQLSIQEIPNSFGTITKYTQPKFLYGVTEALLNINSWIIVFATSLLFSLFLKLIFVFFEEEMLVSQLSSLGLPVENNDFQNLIINVQNTPNLIYITYILFSSVLVLYYLAYRNKSIENKL